MLDNSTTTTDVMHIGLPLVDREGKHLPNLVGFPVFFLMSPFFLFAEEESVISHTASSSSESCYVPSGDESEQEVIAENAGKKKISINVSTDLDASFTVNKVGHSAPDDALMFVKTFESGNKKDFCIYCKSEQGKLSRHVTRLHKDEDDVAQFLSFKKNAPERKTIMAKIRKRGQFFFNTNRVVNTGERKVTRRPNAKYAKNATDFATCPSCLGDYAKSSIRHHFRRCSNKQSVKRRKVLVGSKQVTGRIHPEACKILRQKVFPTLQEDAIVKAIRYDELIILFANKLCQKYKDPHYYDMIRQKMRQLGRFLIEIKKIDKTIDDLFSIYRPLYYDAMLLAVQSLAGLNEGGTGFKVPSLATALGTLIKQVGTLCVTICIKRENEEQQTQAEKFLKLLIEDYPTSISRTALETQAHNKRQSRTVLPSNADIQKLQIYLRDGVRSNYAALKESFSKTAWMNLAQSTVISMQLFNRRRPGEIERLFIDDFKNHEKIDTLGESYEKLTLEEKQLATKYVRFTIRGKLARTVTVLLHIELLEACELLLQHRLAAGVYSKNPYLFGICGTLKGDYKYLRACDLMRKFAVDCGAAKPQTLRGTILRKHIATMCVNFDLSDNQVSDLAGFLGHHEKIHKEIYRQPILNREILHISKLLEAVQGKEDPGDDSDDSDNDDEPSSSMVQNTEIDERRPATNAPSFECSVLDQVDQSSSDGEPSCEPKATKKRSSM